MNSGADLLVVDDEQVVRWAVRKVGSAEGLTVEVAPSVDTGLERLAAQRYRLVLLDLMLPAGGGMRVLEAARRDHRQTPVVMITGYATPERTVECLRGGAFDVLPKPFDTNELLAVLRRALAFAEDPNGRTGRAGNFALGRHAWARVEGEGTAVIGIGESFLPVAAGTTTVETAAVDTELAQGERMATLTSRDGTVHRVWAPLGGRILETRQTWDDDSWVLRLVPTDLENELERLTRT